MGLAIQASVLEKYLVNMIVSSVPSQKVKQTSDGKLLVTK